MHYLEPTLETMERIAKVNSLLDSLVIELEELFNDDVPFENILRDISGFNEFEPRTIAGSLIQGQNGDEGFLQKEVEVMLGIQGPYTVALAIVMVFVSHELKCSRYSLCDDIKNFISGNF